VARLPIVVKLKGGEEDMYTVFGAEKPILLAKSGRPRANRVDLSSAHLR
jgi:hypothetical protein